MKQYLIAALVTAVILFPLFGYVYARGWDDGVERYKRSKSFQMTLNSMYVYGLDDGRAECSHKH